MKAICSVLRKLRENLVNSSCFPLASKTLLCFVLILTVTYLTRQLFYSKMNGKFYTRFSAKLAGQQFNSVGTVISTFFNISYILFLFLIMHLIYDCKP